MNLQGLMMLQFCLYFKPYSIVIQDEMTSAFLVGSLRWFRKWASRKVKQESNALLHDVFFLGTRSGDYLTYGHPQSEI